MHKHIKAHNIGFLSESWDIRNQSINERVNWKDVKLIDSGFNSVTLSLTDERGEEWIAQINAGFQHGDEAYADIENIYNAKFTGKTPEDAIPVDEADVPPEVRMAIEMYIEDDSKKMELAELASRSEDYQDTSTSDADDPRYDNYFDSHNKKEVEHEQINEDAWGNFTDMMRRSMTEPGQEYKIPKPKYKPKGKFWDRMRSSMTEPGEVEPSQYGELLKNVTAKQLIDTFAKVLDSGKFHEIENIVVDAIRQGYLRNDLYNKIK